MNSDSPSQHNGKLISLNGRYSFQRYQFPIMLGWAINVYRVQSLSLDRAVIELHADVLEHGQAYVDLSRVRSVDGVMLTGLTRTAFT